MNHKNPYSELVTMMQSQGAKSNPPAVTLGKVLSPYPNLVVLVGDLQVDKDNLLLADDLLEHQRLTGLATTAATGSTSTAAVGDHGSHAHSIGQIGYTGGKLTVASCLAKDDMVAVLPMEGYQKFIVLCKVVNVGG